MRAVLVRVLCHIMTIVNQNSTTMSVVTHDRAYTIKEQYGWISYVAATLPPNEDIVICRTNHSQLTYYASNTRVYIVHDDKIIYPALPTIITQDGGLKDITIHDPERRQDHSTYTILILTNNSNLWGMMLQLPHNQPSSADMPFLRLVEGCASICTSGDHTVSLSRDGVRTHTCAFDRDEIKTRVFSPVQDFTGYKCSLHGGDEINSSTLVWKGSEMGIVRTWHDRMRYNVLSNDLSVRYAEMIGYNVMVFTSSGTVSNMHISQGCDTVLAVRHYKKEYDDVCCLESNSDKIIWFCIQGEDCDMCRCLRYDRQPSPPYPGAFKLSGLRLTNTQYPVVHYTKAAAVVKRR